MFGKTKKHAKAGRCMTYFPAQVRSPARDCFQKQRLRRQLWRLTQQGQPLQACTQRISRKLTWRRFREIKTRRDELKASDAGASSGVSHKQVQQTTNRQRSKKVKVKSKQTLCTLCLLKSYTANHTIFKSLASECKKSEARGNFESQPQPCQWSEDAFEIKHCEGF